MNLLQTEKERTKIYLMAELARRSKDRGLKLNHSEAVAYIADEICKGAREGKSVSELMEKGTNLLSEEDVMDGVEEMVDMIQVEPMFPDGTKLVTVHNPIKG